jgi:hypothetical protein
MILIRYPLCWLCYGLAQLVYPAKGPATYEETGWRWRTFLWLMMATSDLQGDATWGPWFEMEIEEDEAA